MQRACDHKYITNREQKIVLNCGKKYKLIVSMLSSQNGDVEKGNNFLWKHSEFQLQNRGVADSKS